jgi:hypothetical protein
MHDDLRRFWTARTRNMFLHFRSWNTLSTPGHPPVSCRRADVTDVTEADGDEADEDHASDPIADSRDRCATWGRESGHRTKNGGGRIHYDAGFVTPRAFAVSLCRKAFAFASYAVMAHEVPARAVDRCSNVLKASNVALRLTKLLKSRIGLAFPGSPSHRGWLAIS